MKNYFRKILSLILVIAFVLTAMVPIFAETLNLSISETATQQVTPLLINTTTAMRMQPLVAKYNSLTQADLDLELAKYTDSTKHWGKNYISKISALEIISGYGDSKFGPNDKLLGGQYILMLVRIMGFRPDVPKGTPYYQPFVDIAIKEGILQKGEIVDFKKPITRELAASLARRVIGTYEEIPHDYFVKGVDTEGIGDKGFFDNVYVGYQKIKMTDYTTITSKYLQDVIDCYRMGILSGSNNKFNPKGFLTRAESAVIIVKLLDKGSRVENVPTETVKFMNELSQSTPEGYCSDKYGYYEGKEYTFYRGYFPLMEIYDTVSALLKNRDKISGGAYFSEFNETDKGLGTGWFSTEQIKYDYKFNNEYGLIVPENSVAVITGNTKIPKGQPHSIYDNAMGYLYDVFIKDPDNYNKYEKQYVYELMKVWFGTDYEKAKTLHDKYLNYSLNDQEGVYDIYMINGRQVHFSGGHDLAGRGFEMQVWTKDVLNEQTMFKK